MFDIAKIIKPKLKLTTSSFDLTTMTIMVVAVLMATIGMPIGYTP